jgi:K+-sensing histidine kinase KdpD
LAGIAVSWAALPLICAMYAQAQSKPTGMGIGLSICRSIIEAHEERISATANMPRGVTLHITGKSCVPLAHIYFVLDV